ncbi:MAG: helix-turn-helix transcriptional regulator [Candidatus Aminicenantes bacterium]|nr:helix-turn-helix transcriptional regulator [Candidatus Aminicenantes bacterium]
MKKDNISDMVVEYILMRSDEELADLTVKNIAKAFNLNPSYLSRQFLKDKKFSLGAYLVRMKVFRTAAILREDQEVTVMELAKRMGFCTTGYLIHIFRKFFGTTPGKYRKLLR